MAIVAPAGPRLGQRGIERLGGQGACPLLGAGPDDSHVTVGAGPPVGIMRVDRNETIERIVVLLRQQPSLLTSDRFAPVVSENQRATNLLEQSQPASLRLQSISF